ncbi:MAG: hypothetical protein ACRD1L_11250 [Terriglobales bacterium]
MKIPRLASALAASVLLTAGCFLAGGGQAPAGQPPLRNLTAANVAELQQAFNATPNRVRVLLLLSPT